MSRVHAVGKAARGILRTCVFLVAGSGAVSASAHASVSDGAGSERVSPSAGVHPVGFWLGAEVTEAVRAHTSLSEDLVLEPSVEKTCALVSSAQQLAPLLAASLQSEHAALASQALDDSDIAPLESFEALVSQEDARLIGIGLHAGSEIPYSYVRYNEIADVDGIQPEAAALLRAAAGLWRDSTGWPVHVEQQTDITGCQDPGALIEPLERLTRAWKRAPECVRFLVSEVARHSVRDALSVGSCYCRGQENVIEDSTRLATLARGFDLGITKDEISGLTMHLHRADVRFECLAN